jgi:hypothetical protein
MQVMRFMATEGVEELKVCYEITGSAGFSTTAFLLI